MSQQQEEEKEAVVQVVAEEGGGFTCLPDVILLKIFGDGYLTAREVLQCSKVNDFLSSWFFLHDNEQEEDAKSPSLSSTLTTTTRKMDNENENNDTNHDDNDTVEPAKRLLWRGLLHREGLPGETLCDLIGHLQAWDRYRAELRKSLLELAEEVIVGNNSGEENAITKQQPQQPPELCHEFLTRAIVAYAYRLCNSHSWYKHLPIAANSSYFECYVSLTANMRQQGGGGGAWEELVEGDGTRFHYTWMTTTNYRRKFGNFCYHYDTPFVQRKVFYRNGTQVVMPESDRVPAVSVTAVIHGCSIDWNHYARALRGAIDLGDPNLLTGEIRKEWVQRHHIPGGVLPKEAGEDLKAIADAYLNHSGTAAATAVGCGGGGCGGWENNNSSSGDGLERVEQLTKIWEERFARLFYSNHNIDPTVLYTTDIPPKNNGLGLRDNDDDDNYYAEPNNLYYDSITQWSRVVAFAQRYREHAAIRRALHEVCVRTYGTEWVPPLEKVEQEAEATRRIDW